MKTINKESRVPLYYQLMDIIIEQIETSKLKEYDKVPSERALCDEYKISRATVRQAMQELEKEGYICKEHGKGTFVSPKRFKQELLKFYSFTEEMKKIGKVPSSKVIDFKVIECNEKIAKKMNLKIGEEVYKFTRLRLADGKSVMVSNSYVPYNRFPQINKEDLENEAMYDVFTKRYNAIFTQAKERFTPVLTNKDEAKLLHYSEGLPSMMIERITYEKENIIEYTVGIARGDRFNYFIVLKR